MPEQKNTNVEKRIVLRYMGNSTGEKGFLSSLTYESAVSSKKYHELLFVTAENP